MNRRTLLKVAAASSGVLLGSRIGQRHSFAQAPAYTAEVIYEFTEFLGESYDQLGDGRVAAANAGGVIAGRDVVNGKTVPCTWDLAGSRSLLDTGDIAFGITGFSMPVSSNGLMAADFYAGADWSTQALGISWASGGPELLPTSDPTANAHVTSINNAGVVGGSIAQIASRWLDGQIEQMPLSVGAVSSYVSKLNDAGDGFGATANDIGIFEAFLWKANGAVEGLSIPEELTASPSVVISSLAFTKVFDDGGYVLVAYAKDGEVEVGGTWVMANGTYTKVPSPDATTQSIVSVAVSPTELYGRVNGSGEAIGPAAWIDGVVYPLRAQIVMPNGGNLSTIAGVLEDGTLVASTIPIIGQSTPASIVLLHPA